MFRNRFALGAAALTLCACGATEAPSADPPLRPVRVAVVTDEGGVRERTFSGISRSTQESRLSFRVGGTVVELPVQVGDQLRAGDLIAALNSSTFDLQVQQAQASLAQALANQRNADANYERVKGLYANSNASRNDLDAARANAESARAQVQSARKSLEIAQLDQSYTRLAAASDCTVVSVAVELNENVSVGSEIARVSCGSGIEVGLGIPGSLIGQFAPGMPASVRFTDLPNRTFPATVSEVGVASGASSATFPVTVTLDAYDPAVRSSLSAEVTVQFQRENSGIQVVPAAAVIRDESGTFVYLADPQDDKTAVIRRRPIEIGELTEGGVEIASGLEPGDRVVTAGTSVIRESQTVLLPAQ